MKITKIKGAEAGTITYELQRDISNSRFRAEVSTIYSGVDISQVRLRQAKGYCGNHAKACERPHVGGHHKHCYLEGADWVEFNDLINDALDRLGAEVRVASSVCVLRKGRLRRIRYDSDNFVGGAWQWSKDGPLEHYADYVGAIAPPSQFPIGTPGIYKEQYNCVG